MFYAIQKYRARSMEDFVRSCQIDNIVWNRVLEIKNQHRNKINIYTRDEDVALNV